MSQIFKAGIQSALPGTSQGNEFGINGLHLFVGCWCFSSLAAQLQAGRVRQTAAAAQLPASPECYKRNCLQRGNWHTHIHTTHYSPALLSVSYCCHMKISTLILFFCDFFLYLQLFIAEKICPALGLLKAFQKLFV